MDIFGIKKPVDNSPSGLRKETEGVLSVFRETISNLQNLSDRAIQEKEAKNRQIELLTQESEELDLLANDNNTIIKKFNKLLNVE